MENQLSTESYSHVVILSTGGEKFISRNIHEILKVAGAGDFIELPDGSGFKVSSIMEVLTVAEYEERKGGSTRTEGSGQPYSQNPQNVYEVAAKYRVFNYPQINELAEMVYRRLEKITTGEEFREFCVKYQTLTPDGKVTTTVVRGEKGAEYRVPFAYQLFCDLWNLWQAKRNREDYAKAVSWDSLMRGNLSQITNPKYIQVMAKGLKRFIASRKQDNLEAKNAEQLLLRMWNRYKQLTGKGGGHEIHPGQKAVETGQEAISTGGIGQVA